MKKLYLLGLLALSCLLSACSSRATCDSASTIETIKQMIGKSYYGPEIGREVFKTLEIVDVFTYENNKKAGLSTCKAAFEVTLPSQKKGREEFEYSVLNYESGDEVQLKPGLGEYLGMMIKNDLRTTYEADAPAREQAAKEATAAFVAKFPTGNVCAERFDRAAFISQYAKTKVGSVGYTVNEFRPEVEQKVINDFAQGVVDINFTTTNSGPVNPDDLNTSKMRYTCEGDLQVTLADGSVHKGDAVKIDLLTTDGQNFEVSRNTANDYNLSAAAYAYARQLQFGKQ